MTKSAATRRGGTVRCAIYTRKSSEKRRDPTPCRQRFRDNPRPHGRNCAERARGLRLPIATCSGTRRCPTPGPALAAARDWRRVGTGPPIRFRPRLGREGGCGFGREQPADYLGSLVEMICLSRPAVESWPQSLPASAAAQWQAGVAGGLGRGSCSFQVRLEHRFEDQLERTGFPEASLGGSRSWRPV